MDFRTTLASSNELTMLHKKIKIKNTKSLGLMTKRINDFIKGRKKDFDGVWIRDFKILRNLKCIRI